MTDIISFQLPKIFIEHMTFMKVQSIKEAKTVDPMLHSLKFNIKMFN